MAYIWFHYNNKLQNISLNKSLHYYIYVAYISFWCGRSHGLLLTVVADLGHHLGLVEVGLDGLDLPWIIGKEPELYVVVIFFGTLDSISSHDPLLS